MRTFRRVLAALALLIVPLASHAAQARDASDLFRDEMVDALLKLGWHGPQLADDTRFAVAASGLSWKPAWEGDPLIVRDKRSTTYASAAQRRRAFTGAWKAGDNKTAFAYAFSLVLDPPEGDTATWTGAYDFLRHYDTDFDRALVGVLQAPDQLPLLAAYRYAAADALVYRASTRLLPLFMTLAGSSDRYLRSRAVAAIGVVAYRSREGAGDRVAGLYPVLHETSLSVVQQRMLSEVLRQAAEDKNYRVRAAAALAIGLSGGDDDLPLLDKLVKDRAYLAEPANGKDSKRISFPVRLQAAAALARWGRTVTVDDGVFSGKELRRVLRGGQNVTNDRSDTRRDQITRVRFCDGAW